MERVGAPKPSFSFPERRELASSNWCDESRMTPDRTAAYLQKLARLRDNLLQTENTNLNNAISRTLQPSHHIRTLAGGGHRNSQSQATPPARRRVAFSLDTGPNLHHRMQMEKMVAIERRRSAAMRSPPPLLVGVRAIEDPAKARPKDMVKVKPDLAGDPFDPSALDPVDPMEKVFNMERIRLLNAMMTNQNNPTPPPIKARIKPVLRQANLLTPRRGDEWFITGRYKKEDKKSHRSRIHKGSMHRKNKKNGLVDKQETPSSEVRLDTRSNTLELEYTQNDTICDKGSIPPLMAPVVWDKNQPAAVDSTANFMNAIASTAEANKVEVRTRSSQYDPNNYRPIGTPMTSPRASSGGDSTKRGDDVRRSKEIATALQENIDENSQSYQNYESAAVAKRAAFDDSQANRGRKGGIQVGFKGHRTKHFTDDAIKVPSLATTPVVLDSVDTESKSQQPISIVSAAKFDKPEDTSDSVDTGQGESELLFIPESEVQPQINLRYASPDKVARDEDLSLKKIFRQNELREKEVHNLIEDIKELNKISDTLKNENSPNGKK